MGNLILNWPKLLRPFKNVFSPYIDVYVFAVCYYITSGTKKSDFVFVLEQFKHAGSK